MHSQEALKELEDKAYVLNTLFFDSDFSMLCTLRHESLYASFILTDGKPNLDIESINIIDLDELPEEYKYFNNLNTPVIFNNKTYTYGLCLLNKWCRFKDIKINKLITKKNVEMISRLIYENSTSNKEYYDNLSELNKKLLFFISTIEQSPTLNINEMNDLLDKETISLFKKLPKKNVYLGYILNEALIDRCLQRLGDDCELFKLYRSGSRFSKSQLSRTAINVGYSADADNIVQEEPICTNLLRGLSIKDFFKSAPGSRKGIADKDEYTPKSGYMERTLTMALSPIEIEEEDCGSTNYLKTIVFSNKHAKILTDKWYYDESDNTLKVLDYKTAKSYINKVIYVRSPMTCQTPNFRICQKCFGERHYPTKYIGITAGQIIAERLTQLIMRTFKRSA